MQDRAEELARGSSPGTKTPLRQAAVKRSPSGRIPQWVLDEALGTPSPPSPAEGLAARRPPASKSRRRSVPRDTSPRRAGRLSTGLALAFVVALCFAPGVFSRHVLPAIAPYLPGADIPPRGVEAADSPLGQPPAVAESDAYELYETPPESAQPFLAYDPCRPIHYVVRPDNAPPGGDTIIQEAIAEVSAASGLQFVYDGPTDEAFAEEGRERFQPERYGKRWAPVLITWSDPDEVSRLAADIAGLGGSSSVGARGTPHVLVAGQITLDAPSLRNVLTYHDGREHVRAVIIHELGHVLGLAHVDDPEQLMYAGANGVTSLADGDRAGLALLGTGPCVPEV